MKIGIQGDRGSFNEEALVAFARVEDLNAYEAVYCHTTRGVLSALAHGAIDYGVFAIYNSKSLMVHETLAELGAWSYGVMRYHTMPVRHMLMALSDVTHADVTGIMGHEEAIVQCSETLGREYAGVAVAHGAGDLVDGAGVAAALVAGDTRVARTTAVLGSRAIADAYGLEIIAENLHDDPRNTTTFLLVKRREV